MVTSADVAPNEWDCLVYIAVVEARGTKLAAERLTSQGHPCSRQSLDKIVNRVAAWVGEELLVRDNRRRIYMTARGQEFLEAARNVVNEYKLMRGPLPQQDVPRVACLPHHAAFVALAEESLTQAAGADGAAVPFTIRYLEQRHRGEQAFVRHAVSRLRQNAYDLIIGPPADDVETFESIPLYTAQLEAMVSRNFTGYGMPLRELIQAFRMLVPPREMRSRKNLEEKIIEWAIDDPKREVRVAAETIDTYTSVLSLRLRAARGSHHDHVVVVPSDVARSFKRGMEFAGARPGDFRWVPVFHDHNGAEELVQHPVCVTTRRNRPELAGIVGALKQAVDMIESGTRPGLSGEDFRGRRRAAIPAPRAAESTGPSPPNDTTLARRISGRPTPP